MFLQSPIKQVEPPCSLASREAQGAGTGRTFILPAGLGCQGGTEHTELQDVPAIPATPMGAQDSRESDFSSPFISYK